MIEQLSKRQSYALLFGIIGFIFITIVVGAAYINSQSSIPDTRTLQEKLIDDMRERLGKNTKVEFLGTGDARIIKATVPAEVEWSAEFFVKGASMNSIGVFAKIFENEEYDSVSMVSIVYMVDLIDLYGHSSEDVGLAITMSRKTAEKIQDWAHVNVIAHEDPISYYRTILSEKNGDEFYVDMAIIREFYGR